MKVFLAGATGVVGRRLIPTLGKVGHVVVAMTRTPQRADAIRAAGAEPAIADALDREAVMTVIDRAKPDIVVHQLSALAGVANMRSFDRAFADTNRLRTDGTVHLLAAAQAAGVRKFVAQSYCGWPFARVGGPVKTENDPLDPDPPKPFRQTLDAIRFLETTVAAAPDLTGIVLRYGGFYGPTTSLGAGGAHINMVRRRLLPVIGRGTGVWSFIHIDDVVSATCVAIERDAAGVYNVVDDEPAPVSEWLPDLAAAIGAKPPRHMPVCLARPLLGEATVIMMTQVRGGSNSKFKRALDWRPRYRTWRDGFRNGLGAEA